MADISYHRVLQTLHVVETFKIDPMRAHSSPCGLANVFLLLKLLRTMVRRIDSPLAPHLNGLCDDFWSFDGNSGTDDFPVIHPPEYSINCCKNWIR